jgi:uroporphyrin-III C-methyltransferase/precorrin-2 dehydrogenase/sirohydrochlorin ferrochelatase
VKHLPLFFDLAGRRVVVVGSGAMADRRAELARSAGAAVFQLESASAADLAGAAAVFVATGDLDADSDARRAAKQAGVPVNVADRPALSDFILPAIIDRGDVVVAVSTGGASPTLATVLRARIEALLPERIGALAGLAQAFRGQAKALISDPSRRRAFWRRLVEGPAARMMLAGQEAAARRAALGELDDARDDARQGAQRVRQSIGIAHIVGAGPGDPDLLTLRAAQLLQEADAILHDDLVPPAILNRARREAELVPVGKRKGKASWAQREIEAEMIRRVRAGQTVLRLKGGDPFVFGRGAEEVAALRAAGLPVTVVPGITAALGAAAAAGIPLTDRRIASSVTFQSGHAAAESGGGHTHVIYMGATEAASVRDRLLDAGASPMTPVAIVENATRPDQRVSVGRLADLARLALPHTSRSDAGPSLIIVGEVAALADTADEPLAEVS